MQLTVLHGVTQPGYSVARHMAELLSGLPTATVDILAVRILRAIGVNVEDTEDVCEVLSMPADGLYIPPNGFRGIFDVVSSFPSDDLDLVPVRLDEKLYRVSQVAMAFTGRAVGAAFVRHVMRQSGAIDGHAYTAAVSRQFRRLRDRDHHAFRELTKRFGSDDQLRQSSRVPLHSDLLAAKTGRAGSNSMWGRQDWLRLGLDKGLDSPSRLLALGVRAEEFARHRLAADGAALVTAKDAIHAAAAKALELDLPLMVQEFMRAGDYSVYGDVRKATGARLIQSPICAWDVETHPDFMVGVLELVRRTRSVE
ncbi:hypothetical protein [Rathayibacter sp. AY1E1]|uniref:hypothetical protein n=1 Tax=Rathayibacter sp. AY1E1 TaxID=2080549 RepID=UPI0011AFD3FB|nr:hypothetical protein [Rathayibacter sp. AY1E1]